MVLYKRVIQISEKIAGSRAKLAEKLALETRTFQGYLKESRQNNLWPLLPQILEIFPQISRDWLYFGEGDILGGEDTTNSHVNKKIHALECECEVLRARLADKEKIIALYEEREQNSQKIFTHQTDAHGTQSVVPLSHQDNEGRQ